MADVGTAAQAQATMVASVDEQKEQQRLQDYAQGRVEFDAVAGYFQAAAQTGVTRFEWPVLREAILRRATQLGERLKHEDGGDDNSKNSSSEPADKKHTATNNEHVAKLKAALADLPQPPFTIQRIFEMLTDEATLTLRHSRFWQNLLQLSRVTVTVSPRPETFDFAMKPRRETGKEAMATIKEGDPGDEEKQEVGGFPLMEADEEDSLPLTQQERLLSTVLEQDTDEQQEDAGKEGQERNIKEGAEADDHHHHHEQQQQPDTAGAEQAEEQASDATAASNGRSSQRDDATGAAQTGTESSTLTASTGQQSVADDSAKRTARSDANEGTSTAGPPTKMAKQGTAL